MRVRLVPFAGLRRSPMMDQVVLRSSSAIRWPPTNPPAPVMSTVLSPPVTAAERSLVGCSCLQSGSLAQGLRLVGALPGQVEVRPAEVTVGSHLSVDGAHQVKVFD